MSETVIWGSATDYKPPRYRVDKAEILFGNSEIALWENIMHTGDWDEALQYAKAKAKWGIRTRVVDTQGANQ